MAVTARLFSAKQWGGWVGERPVNSNHWSSSNGNSQAPACGYSLSGQKQTTLEKLHKVTFGDYSSLNPPASMASGSASCRKV